MPPPDNRPKEPQSYPLLPAAGEPPAKEAARATNVSFVFSNKRWFNRPWSRLIGADLELDHGSPTLAFTFGDMLAKVKFLSEDEKDYLPYWQSYLDGRLTMIEEKADHCEIKIIAQDVTENFTRMYPPVGRGGGGGGGSTDAQRGEGGEADAGEHANDEPPGLDDDPGGSQQPPEDDFEEPGF